MQPDEVLYKEYIKNVKAYVAEEKIDGKLPDERLMRPIEEAMGVELEYWVNEFRYRLVEKLHSGYDWRKDINMVYAIQQIVGGG